MRDILQVFGHSCTHGGCVCVHTHARYLSYTLYLVGFARARAPRFDRRVRARYARMVPSHYSHAYVHNRRRSGHHAVVAGGPRHRRSNWLAYTGRTTTLHLPPTWRMPRRPSKPSGGARPTPCLAGLDRDVGSCFFGGFLNPLQFQFGQPNIRIHRKYKLF